MRKFLALAFFLTSATIFAQGTLTGKVLDSETNGPLPGANIMVVGTNNGTVTDFDGNFNLKVEKNTGEIEISFIGYQRKLVPFSVANGATQDFGQIVLSPDADALEEIVITSFSLAVDRKTPVAVSTIKAADIETKMGNQEFPEILKSTPGVYATKQGGGFGDAELRLRGFNSENIAVMINGVPVNDMENGRVYWSNWAGLSDVTRSMQVQRGLGASKVAVPSIGGTVNIVTKTTDAEEGGNIFATTGNDGYQKFGATVSTGLLDNGVAATVSASKTTGNGYIDGTEFEAYSYFVNISKDWDDHQLSFTAFGAPQEHGQRETQHLIETYRLSERGTKFNGDWGYLNGEVTHIQDNFYHKPQMSLNHYWDISEKTNLSTAVYASFGTGGGGGYSGSADLRSIDSPYRSGFLQPFNLDLVVAENVENGDLGSETILYDSRNDHKWYGALSTLSTDITETIEVLGGVDFRYYKGEHFQEVKNLLGGKYWLDDSNENNPIHIARVGDKINYYNDGIVLWEGGFAQVEYSENDLSAFISLAASNTSYKRVDYFNYLDSDPQQETDFIHFFGYSAKGGANYNLDNNHNVFANIGYFEKAPFFNSVFQNFQNIINEDAENQKIFSAELGYGFRSNNMRANVNVYRTRWSDRTFTQSYFDRNTGETFFANILGVDALHQGIEVDFSYRPFSNLTITGMASIGDWNWDSNVTNVFIYDDEQNILNPDSPISLLLEDVPVGGSAQHTYALGLDYEALPGTNVRLDYNYYDNLYADFDPNRVSEGYMPWEVPDYGVVDFGLTHEFEMGDFEAILIGNINNLLDTEYIAVADDGQQSNARTAQVYYGFGRTYTVGAKIKF